MIIEEIRDALFQFKDDKYKAFQSGLIPGVDPDCFIGVRTPVLRKYARDLSGKPEIGDFLNDLPHRYFDENQLHAFIVSEIRDYEKCMEAVNRFLPYVDNWATCDQMSPKVFKKYRQDLLEYIKIWICSDETYTIRFGIGMLMQHFLDDAFDPAYPEMVARIRSDRKSVV